MYKFLCCLYYAAKKVIADDGVEHAGYMSFMVLLSLFPFIVFFLAFTSLLGASESGISFVKSLFDILPKYTTLAIKDRIYELLKTPPQTLMTLAIVGSIWTASSFVEGLRTILNRVYRLTSTPPYLLRRLLSIMQFLIISLVIFVAMITLVFIPAVIKRLPEITELLSIYTKGIPVLYIRRVMIGLSLFFSTTALYYMIPNVKLTFKQVIPGALITVTLWVLSGSLLSRYLIHYHQLDIVYGSLGSIIVTLLFFYIVNMIFIYGAEFNYLFYYSKKDS